MRVDPHCPHTRFQSSKLRNKAAKLIGKDAAELFGTHVPGHVQITGNQALVECQLESGLPLIVRVPLSYYKGVGARYLVSKEVGNPVICILELVHDDPHLTVPLLVSADLEDAAVDWQAWARKYGLDLLHKPLQEDGYIKLNALNGCASLGEIVPAPRRHHSQFAARRPRFLTRRKIGQTGPMPREAGREMIARN
ncbi:MAG: DUF6101 family protein [Cohaesibacter sp.]|nr:DUF6101 family protein [Cohaesibacter sp.]